MAMANRDEVVPLMAPPRTLDVQQFAKARSSELLSLHDSLKEFRSLASATSIASTLPRHLRRRTSSYSRRSPLPGLYRRNKKRKSNNPPSSQPLKQRKIDPQTSNSVVGTSDGAQSAPKKRLCRRLRRRLEFKPGSSLLSADGTRRLATHVWHAKRFAMTKCWGYCLPLGRPGRGHGSRAVLRWSKDAALLQDASFYNAIQLHGPQLQILRVLHLVLEPFSAVDTVSEAAQLELSGACFGKAVVRFLTLSKFHHTEQGPYDLIAPVLLAWRPVVSKPGTSFSFPEGRQGEEKRDLCLWVHAAAFDEAYHSLQAVCCKLNEESGDVPLQCFSRKGDLGRIDLIGAKSFEVLQKVLFPVSRDQYNNCKVLSELHQLVQPGELPGNAVITMDVFDPRQKQDEQCLSLEVKTSKTQESDGGIDMIKDGVAQGINSLEEPKGSDSTIQANNSLWALDSSDSGSQLRPPVSEKFLSKRRQMNRLAFYGFIKEDASNGTSSGNRKASSERSICPIMLLKHDNQKALVCGWSIILPLSWVSAFWVPLVFAGGHVIGMRERHWLFTEAGLPTFPDDFPDSPAFADIAVVQSMGHDKAPLEKRRTQAHIYRPAEEGKLANGFGIEFNHLFVARTPAKLATVFQESHERGLLLFPAEVQTLKKFKAMDQRLCEGTIAWRVRVETLGADNVSKPEKFCFLRVSIRSFRKGVVNIGATVFEPTSGDYAFWSSMKGSYKKPCVTSASDDGIPCDLNSSRKAIGFVTSEAPRGSKDTVGIAFCDAVSLGKIRARQWLETKWQNDQQIFLIACNKGSNTYRPVFASIALEEGPDIGWF